MNVPESMNSQDIQLRAAAEAHCAKSASDEERSAAALLHELHVHQVELEMQNEALRQTLIDLESSREQLMDFYECSPAGYLTLTDSGWIAASNLAGASLLGVARTELLQRPFARFLTPSDADRWHLHFAKLLSHHDSQELDLHLKHKDGSLIYVHADCQRLRKNGQPATVRVMLTDITRLKETEFELCQAQHLGKIGSWQYDLGSDTVTASEELYRIFGRSSIPSFAAQCETLFPRSAWEQLHDAIQTSKRTGIGFDLELPAFFGDGTPIWIHTRSNPIRNANGDITGLRGSLQDITTRRAREDKLRIYRLVLDQTQDHVTITDLDGIVTYVNQSKVRDNEADGKLGQHVSAYGDGPAADATQQEIVDATLQKGFWSGKVVNYLADGSWILLDLRTTLIHDDKGTPIAMVGVSSDITEKRKTEDALREREQYQRALLDNFPFMVWLKDTEGRYLAVNKAFATITGLPCTESVTGKTDFDLNPADLAETYRADDNAVLESGLAKQLEEPIETGGERRWFETYKSPIVVNGSAVGVVGFARDISARKEIEAELIVARAIAEKANNAKSRFLAAASHDLRQPLAAMALFVGILQHKAGADCRDLVQHIQICVDNLSELLTDLLDVSKLDAGVVAPKLTDIVIDDVLATLVAIHSAEAGQKGLKLRVRRCGLHTHTDPQLLHRMLGNLVGNAIRYTCKGGVLIACRRHQGRQWIEVWDSGIGISSADSSLIFEEFRQLDPSRNRGSGLGLAIVAKAAALLGLEIRMHSRPGRGSMFALELPPGQVETTHESIPEQAATHALRIAVVEDNPLVLQALVLTLKGAGHEVIAASSGAELNQRLGTRAPDVLISDYRLAGGETGFEVIAAARTAFGTALPAGVITGDTDTRLIRHMQANGMSVLFKPIRSEVLLDFIRSATQQA